MTLAMKKLHGMGWIALVFCVAIMLYPLSLKVATAHAELVSVNARISAAKRDISYLQADLRTRANHSQLAEWNALLYGYNVPGAEQYLEGERALASLGGEPVARRPVLVSVTQSLGDAAPQHLMDDSMAAAEDMPVSAPVAAAPVQAAPVRTASAQAATARTATAATSKPRAAAPIRMAQADTGLAAMERKLLSVETLADLRSAANAERAQP